MDCLKEKWPMDSLYLKVRGPLGLKYSSLTLVNLFLLQRGGGESVRALKPLHVQLEMNHSGYVVVYGQAILRPNFLKFEKFRWAC